MKTNIVLVIVGIILIYFALPERTIKHGPGQIAPSAPAQKNLSNQKSRLFKDWWITPLARFEADARVLSKNWHHFNRTRKIVPVDLALGWGRMSDETVLEKMKIYQRGMKYYWSSKQMPIPKKEIISHSANMHIIPASEAIRKKLKKIRKGHHIRFKGYLVGMRSTAGEKWNSSLTRKDSGNGACELVWVEKLEILE